MIHSEKTAMLIFPVACGWRVTLAGENEEPGAAQHPSFSDAATAGFSRAKKLRARAFMDVALPVRYGVFERFTFPSTDPEELAAMVRLQFEKILPYPVEEISIGTQMLRQTDSESTLMACAVHETALGALCAPILQYGLPRRLTFRALQVASHGPAEGIACGIWREEADVVFGIFEHRHLAFVERLPGAGDIQAELPRTLIRANVAGASIKFTEVLLDTIFMEMGDAFGKALGAPCKQIPETPFPSGDGVDFTPQAWRSQQARRKRWLLLRQRLVLAAIVYVTALASALVFVGIKRGQLESLHKQAAALQPQVDAVISRQNRWKALAPAVDSRCYGVELLFQTWECLPSPETRITRFEATRGQLVIEGEAPNAEKAISFSEKLKAKRELADYRFEAGPPVLLPNEHAQFRIFGKQ